MLLQTAVHKDGPFRTRRLAEKLHGGLERPTPAVLIVTKMLFSVLWAACYTYSSKHLLVVQKLQWEILSTLLTQTALNLDAP